MPTTTVPQILLIPATDRELIFTDFLREWLSGLLPMDFMMDRRDNLQFCIFLFRPGTRGSQQFFLEAGRLTEHLGLGKLAVLVLSRGPVKNIPKSMRGFMAFCLAEESMQGLCSEIAHSVSPWTYEEKQRAALRLHVRDAWPSLVAEFERSVALDLDVKFFKTVQEPVIKILGKRISEDDLAGRYLGAAIDAEPSVRLLMHHGALWSMGVPGDDSEQIRYFSMNIFFGSSPAESASAFLEALQVSLAAWDLEIAIGLPTRYGSWYKNLWIRTKDLLTSDGAKRRMAEIEYGIRQSTLESTQADIDLKKAQALEHIARAVESQDSAVVQLGSILLVKKSGKELIAVSLTAEQMIRFASRPELAEMPDGVFAALGSPDLKMLPSAIVDE